MFWLSKSSLAIGVKTRSGKGETVVSLLSLLIGVNLGVVVFDGLDVSKERYEELTAETQRIIQLPDVDNNCNLLSKVSELANNKKELAVISMFIGIYAGTKQANQKA